MFIQIQVEHRPTNENPQTELNEEIDDGWPPRISLEDSGLLDLNGETQILMIRDLRPTPGRDAFEDYARREIFDNDGNDEFPPMFSEGDLGGTDSSGQDPFSGPGSSLETRYDTKLTKMTMVKVDEDPTCQPDQTI